MADGHKVAAFAENKRVFVSSETAGEIAVLDGDETSANYRKLIARIDLCRSAKETTPCNDESATPITTAVTPNASAPHGIRWSTLTKKVYSIQEGYGEIAEIDPATLAITKTFDLAGTPYTSYGISPDEKYLLLRGETTAPQATKLGVIDLSAATPAIANLTIPELDGTSPGAFKFAPNSGRFYILAGNGATATKKDRLFAFDWTTVAPPSLTLLREIPLVSTGGQKAFRLTGHRVGAVIASQARLTEVEKFLDTVAICPSQLGQIGALWGMRNLRQWVAGERDEILAPWVEEAERRGEAYERGEMAAIDFDESIARLKARLAAA